MVIEGGEEGTLREEGACTVNFQVPEGPGRRGWADEYYTVLGLLEHGGGLNLVLGRPAAARLRA